MMNGFGLPRTRRHVVEAVALGSALLLGVSPTRLAGQQTEAAVDSFYASGRVVRVTIPLDQVAILTQEGRGRVDVESLAGRSDLRVVREYPGGIFVLRLPRPLARAALFAFARGLRHQGEGVVGQSGLAVYPAGAEAPLLVTEQFIVEFRPELTRARIDSLNRQGGARVLMRNPLVTNQYLLAVADSAAGDALPLANRFHVRRDDVRFAHPNFIRVVIAREGAAGVAPPSSPFGAPHHTDGAARVGPPEVRDALRVETVPNDPLFVSQWHLRNTGQSGGTVDADIDATLAWDLTQGAATTVIGIIDSGFDMTHPDLTPNLLANAGEIAGNGVDDDGNGFVDDVNGWDFVPCDFAPAPGCGDNTPAGGNHGTAVAGVAAARGNNALGVTGACPQCSLLFVRLPNSDFAQGLAFGYAQQRGAQVITNSWGFAIGTPCATNVCNAINAAATAGRGGLGAVVLFAMNNPNVNDCVGANPDISSLPNVIAVSRATNQDRFGSSGFGNCMEVLAPTHGGTLWIATTDLQAANGYNNAAGAATCPSAEPGTPPANARDYTLCFNGTSSATPLVAGITGLVLTANPALTRAEVQRLLQDTPDKVEDSQGAYSASTGFSAPAAGNATHGWGRVNAFEAVRVVAPAASGGRGGVDIFLRDNRLDWGNTEQPSNMLFEPARGYIGHWRSADIKVDAPPYQAAPIATTFDAFTDETPSATTGAVNRVYVRVRNRGQTTAGSVTVRLFWAQFGTALPQLPTDFWSVFPGNSTDPTNRWNALACSTGTPACSIGNLAYSGGSVATTGADVAQVVRFDFPAPAVDPSLANHFCLLGMIDSPADRIGPLTRTPVADDFVPDRLTPTDNNVTHRNYQNLSTGDRSVFETGFVLRNPLRVPIRAVLRLAAPAGWRIRLDTLDFEESFALAAGEERVVRLSAVLPSAGLSGEVTIVQSRVDVRPMEQMGGVTFVFRGRPQSTATGVTPRGVAAYLVGRIDLQRNRTTVLDIINPNPQRVTIWIGLFDPEGRSIACIERTVAGDGAVRVDPRAQLGRRLSAVVKIVTVPDDTAVIPSRIAARQVHSQGGRIVSEAELLPVPDDVLAGELPVLAKICR